MPGGRAEAAPRARCSTSRTRRSCRSCATRRKVNEDSEAVFYFPGCGSERLFSPGGPRDAGDALPRRRPVRAAAGLPLLRLSADRRGRRTNKGEQIITEQPRAVPPRREHAQLPRHPHRDRVLRDVHGPARRSTSSTRSSPAAACSTSTSTCWRRASSSRASQGVRYMYHDPCHTPMKTHQPLEVVSALMGAAVALNDRCCGESGTLRDDAARHLDPGALAQGRGDAQGRRRRCAPTASPAR